MEPFQWKFRVVSGVLQYPITDRDLDETMLKPRFRCDSDPSQSLGSALCDGTGKTWYREDFIGYISQSNETDVSTTNRGYT